MNGTELVSALADLLRIVNDARQDEEVDAMTVAGGYLCGDVMSEAVERAEAAITKAEAISAIQASADDLRERISARHQS